MQISNYMHEYVLYFKLCAVGTLFRKGRIKVTMAERIAVSHQAGVILSAFLRYTLEEEIFMTKESCRAISNREVKDSAFTAYFREPENASRLYAALGDEEVTPDDITYVTLEGVLFVARKNDLAFTVKNRVLVISEHQLTINENMPLRDLLYLGRTLEKLLDERTRYKRRQFRIPTPEFYVFYNGNETCPPEKILWSIWAPDGFATRRLNGQSGTAK